MIVKGIAKLKRILFSKGDFIIGAFEPVEIEEGVLELNEKYGTFTLKGDMPAMKEGAEYYFTAEEGQRHPKYGLSYDVVFIRHNINLDPTDKESVKEFLKVILTERQLKALLETFDDPIKVIESKDVDMLTQAYGIGKRTAERVIEHYEDHKDYSSAYIELGKFGLSPKTIRKIATFYGSPELAIQKIKENPYQLMEIDGYGFKKCDEIFSKMGGNPNAEIRIKSFLIHFLQEEANNGHTWTTPIDLINATVEFIPNADKALIGKVLLSDSDTFYLTDDKKKISLAKYQRIELSVANELLRILKAENTFDYEGWEEEVEKVEEKQGWNFTEQQKEAMKMMFENNVLILQGYGGTGKTTTLKAVVDVLEKKGYKYAQCALSGKASNNLALVTGKYGNTIHRLLYYSPKHGGFYYNKNNQLPYDIIIVDEISMVDVLLFNYLLQAIRTGAKLIMLGDSQQLESIGIPVMMPMIESGVIPTMTLTQIHRQAQKSAVVTDSIAIRQGKQIITEPISVGRVVHGELKDLEYELTQSDDDIFLNVMREFYKYIQTEDIMDIQIITQVRNKGKNSCLALNKACQRLYNPPSEDKQEVQIGRDDTGYILREGDKVINVKNNYSAVDEHGNECPVYNGNIGILEKFDTDEEGEFMLINFEGIGRVKIYKDFYDTIELAYAITVHKSQGSSSKIIIIAFPYHYLLNTRQMLYTAITRTREHCIVVATKKTIALAIKKDEVSNKRTYLANYLANDF